MKLDCIAVRFWCVESASIACTYVEFFLRLASSFDCSLGCILVVLLAFYDKLMQHEPSGPNM